MRWLSPPDRVAAPRPSVSKAKNGSIFDKKAADLYRKNILEKGGSAKPMDLYRAFRGGEPSIDALLLRDGIKK